MKQLFFTSIITFLFSAACYAQTDTTEVDAGNKMLAMINTRISMEVDTLLYKIKGGNFYVSKDSQAMIMAMLIPQSFEQAKEKLSKNVKNRNVIIKETGELEANGKKVAFKTGELNEEGKKMMIELYAIEVTKESTILVTGVYLLKDKQRFANTARKAAVTAKIE